MKKLFCVLVLLFLLGSSAEAAWTITPSLMDEKGAYIYIKIECISDGSASGYVDIVNLMNPHLKRLVERGMAMMVVSVVPGTGGATPQTTIDFGFYDINELALYNTTGVSNIANTIGLDLSDDLSQYPPMLTTTNIYIADIGDAADSVTFYMHCWLTR